MSTVSSSWNGNDAAANSSITWFRILKDMSTILERIMTFDKGTASTFFLCSKAQTSPAFSTTLPRLRRMLQGKAFGAIQVLVKFQLPQIEPTQNISNVSEAFAGWTNMRCSFSFAGFTLALTRTLPDRKHCSFCVSSHSAMKGKPKNK